MIDKLTIKETMWILSVVIPIIFTVLLAALGFMIKRWMDNIEARERQDFLSIMGKLESTDNKIKEICRNQAACQSQLPEKYVLRQSCDRDMADVKGIIRHNTTYGYPRVQ